MVHLGAQLGARSDSEPETEDARKPLLCRGFSDAGGGTRTPDTRIMRPTARKPARISAAECGTEEPVGQVGDGVGLTDEQVPVAGERERRSADDEADLTAVARRAHL